MNHHIDTPRLRLIPCDKEIFENIFLGDKALSAYLNIKVTHNWNEHGEMPFRFASEKIAENPEDKKWWAYLAVQVDLKVLLGSCGYKGKPDETGTVEIGYQVAEKFRNQGYAYEMAKALIKHAFSHKEVTRVLAHTLPLENASVKVLRRCGMKNIGEHIDAEDGKVWRWEITKL